MFEPTSELLEGYGVAVTNWATGAVILPYGIGTPQKPAEESRGLKLMVWKFTSARGVTRRFEDEIAMEK